MSNNVNLLFKFTSLTIIIGLISNSDCSIVDEDLIITQNQKFILEKFRSRMSPIVPHAYMREDIYLIRWLRARNFNLNDAEFFLRENLKWRKSTGMEKIHSEDFSSTILDYPVFVDTVDKNGAPVITCPLGVHDIRLAHSVGHAPKFLRFVDKIMDEAEMKVREAQHERKNVTRFHGIINLEGFNLVQHGCPRCYLGAVAFITSYENHFPELTDKIVIINAPSYMQAILKALRVFISTRTRRKITVFGNNKKEWQNYLLSFIDEEQLTEDFGGTRLRHD